MTMSKNLLKGLFGHGQCAFEAWQKRKQDVIMHPFLQEKIPWGLVPFVQAQLLARYIRGDIDEYPSYLWK